LRHVLFPPPAPQKTKRLNPCTRTWNQPPNQVILLLWWSSPFWARCSLVLILSLFFLPSLVSFLVFLLPSFFSSWFSHAENP
jgi:hypothetical protein